MSVVSHRNVSVPTVASNSDTGTTNVTSLARMPTAAPHRNTGMPTVPHTDSGKRNVASHTNTDTATVASHTSTGKPSNASRERAHIYTHPNLR